MKVKITLKQLEDLGACYHYRRAFEREYGDSYKFKWTVERQIETLQHSTWRGILPWAFAKQLLPMWSMEGQDLSGLDLHEANLLRMDLTGVNLSGANLSGAILNRALLSGANLDNANLSRVDASFAILSGSSLYETVLSRTNFHGAELSGANLAKTDLSEAHLGYALYDNYTIFPEGFTPISLTNRSR